MDNKNRIYELLNFESFEKKFRNNKNLFNKKNIEFFYSFSWG